jgi:hypothetical protein
MQVWGLLMHKCNSLGHDIAVLKSAVHEFPQVQVQAPSLPSLLSRLTTSATTNAPSSWTLVTVRQFVSGASLRPASPLHMFGPALRHHLSMPELHHHHH